MTILSWRRNRDPETDDFVYSFEPKPDITTFELATLMRAGVVMQGRYGQGFKVAPRDLYDLAEQTGSAFRHLHQSDKPARESWPVLRYQPGRKAA